MTDIWNKEIVLTDEDKQRLGITDEQIAAMKAKKQQNNFADYVNTGEQLVTSALNGVSQGYYDEYEGGASALGNGLANLGMRAGHALGFNIQAPQEDVWTAMKRGYINGRDYRRQVLEDSRREMPLLSTGVEAAGAIVSPANKVLDVSKYAPRSVQMANDTKNIYKLGVINGVGNSNENTRYDLGENVLASTIGNRIGNSITNQMYGAIGMPIARNTANGIISQPVQSGVSNIADKINNYWNNNR